MCRVLVFNVFKLLMLAFLLGPVVWYGGYVGLPQPQLPLGRCIKRPSTLFSPSARNPCSL